MLPNRLHREGAERLWRQGFLLAGGITWHLGVTGWSVPDDPERRPDHTSGGSGGFGLDADTTYAEVAASDGGAWSAGHLALMETAGEQAVEFTIGDDGRSESDEIVIANAIPWDQYSLEPCGGWLADGVYTPNRTSGEFESIGGSYPLAGWPWSTPIMWPGRWGAAWNGSGRPEYVDATHWQIATSAVPASGSWAGANVYLTDKNSCTRYGPFTLDSLDGTNLVFVGDHYATGLNEAITYNYSVRAVDDAREAIEANPHVAASFPIGAVYLAAEVAGTKYLVASAVMAADVVLFAASEELSICYRSQVRGDSEDMRLSRWFCASLASRMFAASGAAAWSGLQVGLGNVDVATLTPDMTVVQVGEIAGTGYARKNVGSWSVAVDVNDEPTATLDLPNVFENTGDVPWSEANAVFLVGSIDGTERLLAVSAITDVELPASETLDVVELAFPWVGVDYGG